MAGRKRSAPLPVDDTPPPALDDAPTSGLKDPGTYISPERVSACIERIFNGGLRLKFDRADIAA